MRAWNQRRGWVEQMGLMRSGKSKGSRGLFRQVFRPTFAGGRQLSIGTREGHISGLWKEVSDELMRPKSGFVERGITHNGQSDVITQPAWRGQEHAKTQGLWATSIPGTSQRSFAHPSCEGASGDGGRASGESRWRFLFWVATRSPRGRQMLPPRSRGGVRE